MLIRTGLYTEILAWRRKRTNPFKDPATVLDIWVSLRDESMFGASAVLTKYVLREWRFLFFFFAGKGLSFEALDLLL